MAQPHRINMMITPTLCQNSAASGLPFERDCLPAKNHSSETRMPPRTQCCLKNCDHSLGIPVVPRSSMDSSPAVTVSFAPLPVDQPLHSQHLPECQGRFPRRLRELRQLSHLSARSTTALVADGITVPDVAPVTLKNSVVPICPLIQLAVFASTYLPAGRSVHSAQAFFRSVARWYRLKNCTPLAAVEPLY